VRTCDDRDELRLRRDLGAGEREQLLVREKVHIVRGVDGLRDAVDLVRDLKKSTQSIRWTGVEGTSKLPGAPRRSWESSSISSILQRRQTLELSARGTPRAGGTRT
jgi:hypothetical protein